MSLMLDEMLLNGGSSGDGLYFVTRNFASGGAPSTTVPTAVKSGDLILVHSTVANLGAAATATALPAGYTSIFNTATFTSGISVYSGRTFGKISNGTEGGSTIQTFTGGMGGSICIWIIRRKSGPINSIVYSQQTNNNSATAPAALSTVNISGTPTLCSYFIIMSVNSNNTQPIQYTITNPTEFIEVFAEASNPSNQCHVYALENFSTGETPINNTYKLSTTGGANIYAQRHFVAQFT